MQNSNLCHILSSVHTFDEYEKFKLNVGILESLAREVLNLLQLPDLSLTLFTEGTNIVFAYGDRNVIKIFPPFHYEQFKSELLVMNHLQGRLSVHTPTVQFDGEIYGWPYIIMTRLEGTNLELLWEDIDHSNKMIIIQELGALIREVHALPTDGLEDIDCHWQQFIEYQINHCIEQHTKYLPKYLLQQIPDYLESIRNSLLQIKNPVILTGEYTPMNFLVVQISGVWHIHGLIDFGDSMLGRAEYDLLGPGAFLIQGDKVLLKAFLSAYGYSSDMMSTTLSHQLTALMLLHKYSNLKIQIRIQNWECKVNSIMDLESLVWGF